MKSNAPTRGPAGGSCPTQADPGALATQIPGVSLAGNAPLAKACATPAGPANSTGSTAAVAGSPTAWPVESRSAAARVLALGMGWFTEEPGGLNRMYAGLYEALQQQGVGLRGLIAGDPSAGGPVPDGVAYFARRDAGLMTRLLGVRRATRRLVDGADVVAAHFAPYALPALDLVRGRPFIFHFHGPWARESHAEGESGASVLAKRAMESRVYRRADRCIVLSRAFGHILQNDYGVAPEKIHVIPGGVDVERFASIPSRRSCRESFNLPPERPIIGTARRLVQRVGIDLLIAALAELRAACPEVLLLIAGRGPQEAQLAGQVARLGLQNNVRFLGFVNDAELPHFYGACDVTVVPSVALEGFGLTTIESLASGTPVLVTPVGGLPETVEALDPGLILPTATSGALYAGLARALREPSTLPSIEACREHARSQFSWPVIARRTLEVYRG